MSIFNDAAPFPYQLIRCLDRRDGNVKFNYALTSGHQSYVISHLREALEGAQRLPAKYCKKALANAAEFVIRHHDTSEEVSRQWSAHVNALIARYDERRAAIAHFSENAFA